jgi:nitroimidazol reductase NimA-like FMN-containing flavoprotein (pyridoxamine 5'-phosphate oxidase superfamily)
MPTDIPTDHSGLRVMGTDECLERLGSTAVGRVAFARDGEIALLPVHHVVRGMNVYFRTSGGSKIEAAADNDSMGFETDKYDESSATGWSVTVTGTASVVENDELESELDGLNREPWPIGDAARTVWVQIRSDQITGREILPH